MKASRSNNRKGGDDKTVLSSFRMRKMSRREEDNGVNRNYSSNSPSRDEMRAVFQMCRSNKWTSVLNMCRSNVLIPATNMTMDNNISTTIIHQAITSKGDTKKRAIVIQDILDIAPHSVAIRNGYGSLPLHVITQRNTKMDSATKEMLIRKLIDAYPGALTQQGGVSRRTPLHIIFTDYQSPRLTETMIQRGKQSCFMIDKKGFLPVHVACSRHCSPEKLDMLLQVNPNSLTAITNNGDTLLSLASKTATKSHPNYALVNDIRRRLNLSAAATALPSATVDPYTVHSNRVSCIESSDQGKKNSGPKGFESSLRFTSSFELSTSRSTSRKRKVTADDQENKTTIKQEDSEQAYLLLHFSRHMKDELGVNIAHV